MRSLTRPGRSATLLLLAALAVPVQSATPPALSNPDIEPEPPLGATYQGALEGTAAVSAGGNATYTIPIEVPPGTRGVQPSLSGFRPEHARLLQYIAAESDGIGRVPARSEASSLLHRCTAIGEDLVNFLAFIGDI